MVATPAGPAASPSASPAGSAATAGSVTRAQSILLAASLATLGVALAASWSHLSFAGDVLWHNLNGTIIWRHGFLRHPVMTYGAGAHYIDPEWGFDAWLALWQGWLGGLGMRLVALFPLLVICAIVIRRSLRSAASPYVVCLAWAYLALVVADFERARPQNYAYMFWVIALVLLDEARHQPRKALWLVPLGVLWANVHGTFLLLVVTLVAETVWSVAAGRADPSGRSSLAPLPLRWSAGMLLGVGAAVCVNPYGPALAAAQVTAATWAPMRQIVEWMPFPLANPVAAAVVAGALCAGAAACSGRLARAGGLEPIAGAVGIFAGITSAVLAPYGVLATVLAAGRWKPGGGLGAVRVSRRWAAAGLAGFLLVVAGFSAALWQPYAAPQSAAPTQAGAHLPPSAERVLTTYYWGDWLVTTGRPALVYGDTFPYVGRQRFQDYLAVRNVTTDPTPYLDRWGIQAILWPVHQPLSEWLSVNRDWKRTWRDSTAVLYERVAPRR